MKRNLLTIALVAGVVLTAQARQRTLGEMRQAAAGVLAVTNGVKGAPFNLESLKVLHQASQLTVLGTDNGGYAVISNDDAFTPVLGYSDTPYGKEHAPGFVWWMETMEKSLANALENGNTDLTVRRDASYKTSVDELITARWGQDTPFNNLAPTYTENGEQTHYVTGCVATAMSMIMRHHKYPEHGMGKRSYRFTPGDGSSGAMTLTADFENTYYDWDNMIDVYTEGNYTEAQANAVATLMYHCGVAVKMTYTSTGSGAYSSEACKALRNYFRYNGYIKVYSRTYFPKDEWMNLIYRELNDGCPILYGGQSTGGGHEFILDGYNEQNLIHVNWGWNGSDNGFFDIAALHGYSSGQELVEMRDSTDTRFNGYYRSLWGTDKAVRMAKNGTTAVNVNCDAIYQMDIDDFTGNIDVVAMNQDNGEVTYLSRVVSFTRQQMRYGTSVSNVTAEVGNLPDGTYRVYLASMSTLAGKEDKEYQPVRSSESVANSYIVVIEGGVIKSLKIDRSGNWTANGIADITDKTPAYGDNTVRVFDTAGRMVYSAPRAAFNINNVEAKGVLVVKDGTETKKYIRQ